MVISIIIWGLLILAAPPFYHGIKYTLTGDRKYKDFYFGTDWLEEEAEEEKPYYIEEQINALLEKIRVQHETLNRLTERIDYTTDTDKKLALENKKADILLKLANLEEKLNKLYDKWGD